MEKNYPQIVYDSALQGFQCLGNWSVLLLDTLQNQLLQISIPKGEKVIVDGQAISDMDSAGALALLDFSRRVKAAGMNTDWVNFQKNHKDLLELVSSKDEELTYNIPPAEEPGILYQIGVETINKLKQLDGLIILVGDLSTKIFESLGSLKRFKFSSIVSNIDASGVTALPILALLSFLIGVVLAYQMGLQLQTYGANIFIAFLSGMAIFREFGPLITAIIVAGRTSSAYTAQIGSMKINEEVDALLTMGLSPTELLVMPKVIGLTLVFPLLIFWADFFSILGAMFMSKSMLDIGYMDFLVRLKDSVGLKQMMLGLYKAPAFSILIALVGCFQGFRVEPTADSVGKQTTRSVVQALFLIIIADAAYSIIYSWMDL